MASVLCGRWETLNEAVPGTLSTTILEQLESNGFPQMTIVQRATVPAFLGYRDVAVEAMTGSGKTLAFVVPLVQYFITHHPESVFAVVIEPTHDLAYQVIDVFRGFPQVRTYSVVGGSESAAENAEYIRRERPSVVLGTAGRLHELVLGFSAIFRTVQFLVIDEADQILRVGLEVEMCAILDALPRQRRTGLFSATLGECERLIHAGMRNPVYLRVSGQTNLQNYWAPVDPNLRLIQLINFVTMEAAFEKVLIFVLTQACARYIGDILRKVIESRSIDVLCGSMEAEDRRGAIGRFSSSQVGILIATDVAARGLDFPDVGWIIQFDAPQDPLLFIHRVGRTARFGRPGSAVVFLREHEDAFFEYLKNEGLSIQELTLALPENGEEMLTRIRGFVRDDVDLYKKSVLAMVSYAQAYGRHKLRGLFVKSELDFIALANSFGMVHLPKMPELRGNIGISDFNARWKEFAEPHRSVRWREDEEVQDSRRKPQKRWPKR